MVINFDRICSVIKIYIICCIPAQIPYLGKTLFLRYRPKCSQSVRWQDFNINCFSRIYWWNSLICACWYKFTKYKSWFKIVWLDMVKYWCVQSGLRTLKVTVSQEWTDGINWFFISCYTFMQIKRWLKTFWVGIVKNGCDCIRRINRWSYIGFGMRLLEVITYENGNY